MRIEGVFHLEKEIGVFFGWLYGVVWSGVGNGGKVIGKKFDVCLCG